MAALAWQRAAATAAANELTFSEILLCHSVPILFRCRSAFLSKKTIIKRSGKFLWTPGFIFWRLYFVAMLICFFVTMFVKSS